MNKRKGKEKEREKLNKTKKYDQKGKKILQSVVTENKE